MMIEALIFARLRDLAPHLYPGAAPKEYATPAVIFNRIATDFGDDLDGETGEAFVTIQIDVYDPEYLAGKTVARAIRLNLAAWRDPMVGAISCDGEDDSLDTTTPTTLYRTRMTFAVFASV